MGFLTFRELSFLPSIPTLQRQMLVSNEATLFVAGTTDLWENELTLFSMVAKAPVNSKVDLVIDREGEQISKSVTIKSRDHYLDERGFQIQRPNFD